MIYTHGNKDLGKYWEKNGQKRIYFDAKDIKKLLKFDIFEGGDGSRINGEILTNEQAHELLTYINSIKFYYDINKKTWVLKAYGASCFIKNSDIKNRLIASAGKNKWWLR